MTLYAFRINILCAVYLAIANIFLSKLNEIFAKRKGSKKSPFNRSHYFFAASFFSSFLAGAGAALTSLAGAVAAGLASLAGAVCATAVAAKRVAAVNATIDFI